ncbi:MAG: hypothetical protein LBQ02_01395 [Candidatus Nomurabacteria bacterium]|nr:hypothetical protein [Candidatus Nomurabacteria bacterium]
MARVSGKQLNIILNARRTENAVMNKLRQNKADVATRVKKMVLMGFLVILAGVLFNVKSLPQQPALAAKQPAGTICNSAPNTPTGSSSTVFAGCGTADKPYLIQDVADFQALANGIKAGDPNIAWGAYYQQTTDLDFSGVDDFVPVGYDTHWFKGVYDGGGNTISNITLNDTSGAGKNGIGVFGRVASTYNNSDVEVNAFSFRCYYEDSAQVCPNLAVRIFNLNLANINFAGTEQVGGLIGRASFAENIYTYPHHVHGLATHGVFVENITANRINIAGNRYVGGLIGRAQDKMAIDGVEISDLSIVNSSSDTGGLIGRAFNLCDWKDSTSDDEYQDCNNDEYDWVRISGSRASGVFSASTNVGGLIGNASKVKVSVQDSSADIKLENGANMSGVGGVVGVFQGVCYGYREEVSQWFWLAKHCMEDTWQSLQIKNTAATGRITGTVASGSVRIGGLVGYGKSDQSVVKIENSSSDVDITLSSETASKDVGGLAGLIKSSAGISGGDSDEEIDLSDGVILVSSYSLGDIVINSDSAQNGTISNVGGLIGNADADDNRMTITNSYSKSNIHGAGLANRIGGLIGYADVDLGQFMLADSFAENQVAGENRVGGLIGEINVWCGNSTTGVDYSKALCKTAPLTTSITNVYHRGNVVATAADAAGGIIGQVKADDNEIVVRNAYQTCHVSAATGRAGGIVGNISITSKDNSSLDNPRDGKFTLSNSVAILADVVPTTATESEPETVGRIFGKVNHADLLTVSDNYGWNGEKVVLSDPPAAGDVVRDDLLNMESDKDGAGFSGLSLVTSDFFSGVFSSGASGWTTNAGKLGVLSAIPTAAQNNNLPSCITIAADVIDAPNTGSLVAEMSLLTQITPSVIVVATAMCGALIIAWLARRKSRRVMLKRPCKSS